MTISNDDIDTLLTMRELKTPAGFTSRVMASVESEIDVNLEDGYSLPDVMQWLALFLGGLYGMAQSLYFLLGVWFVTATG